MGWRYGLHCINGKGILQRGVLLIFFAKKINNTPLSSCFLFQVIFKMNKKQKIAAFNPSGVGINNGHFIGPPFNKKESDVILFPVPWDVTVSFGGGTSTGPQNILECST